MGNIQHIGAVLALNARLYPERIGAADLDRALTFAQWNARACRLANALLGLGLEKGDRVAVLAYNRIEWLEIYAAAAKAGLVAVPVNFRLTGPEAAFIIGNCEARALIVEEDLAGVIEEVRGDLPVPDGNFILIGGGQGGYRTYEDIIASGRDSEPDAGVTPGDTWTLMYTSGTTGRPKGAIRSHQGSALLSLVTEVEMGFSRTDHGLLVMPMCHANSLYFFGALTYCGAPVTVYSLRSFDPGHMLATLAERGISFTSLVPTHYIMMLALSEADKARHDVGCVTKLMISSAPARRDTKLAIMQQFNNSGLFELYGSTEAGWVTMLHPDEQLSRLGSVGRECVGSKPIRILDPKGDEVPDGEAGELYSSNPYTFDGYWKLPDKTAEAFRGDYCTVGDMARRDADGYIHLVDRKSNMIISGGENVYPSEVENLLGAHPAIKEVAVIGVPHEKWGESVHAVAVLHEGTSLSEAELLDWARPRIAGYKRPRSATFVHDNEMPRTATGKILHRMLKLRYSEGKT